MKIRSLVVIAAVFLIIVIGVIISINGCGKSLVGSTATSSQQAQTALDKGDYTTAVSEATKVIENASSTSDEKADAYTVVGQAKLGEVLTSKNTTTAKILTAIADNVASKGENMSSLAKDLIIEPTLTSASSVSTLAWPNEPTPEVNSDMAVSSLKKIVIKVQSGKYNLTNPANGTAIAEGSSALEKALGYWQHLNDQERTDTLGTAFTSNLFIVQSLVTWAFSKDSKTQIEDETGVTDDIKNATSGPDEIKTRWFAINFVDPSTITGKSTQEIVNLMSSEATAAGGVTNRIHRMAGLTQVVKSSDGKPYFTAGSDSGTDQIKNDMVTVQRKIDEFNALFFNGGKAQYADVNKYILKKKNGQ